MDVVKGTLQDGASGASLSRRSSTVLLFALAENRVIAFTLLKNVPIATELEEADMKSLALSEDRSSDACVILPERPWVSGAGSRCGNSHLVS